MKSTFLISEFEENLSLGYPHTNGFADRGQSLILCRRTPEQATLVRADLASGKRQDLCSFDREAQPEKLLWPDVAWDANRLTTIADNVVWLVDLDDPAPLPRALYRAPDLHSLHPLPGICRDGTRVVFALYGPEHNRIMQVNAATGASETLLQTDRWVDHIHYCPFDEEWIGFSHEGKCEVVMDRVMAWHAQHAPQGRCYFDQMEGDPERNLFVGHERWSFHDRSVLIVAYGDSTGKPRGIYEAFVDGRPQRLVSEGDRDMHLDVSRDGRWVVVDTSGPHDLPGKGWQDANERSDIGFIDRATGERRYVARTNISRHPSHPHPIFSPDGSRVYYNEGETGGTRNRVWCALNPFVASPAA